MTKRDELIALGRVGAKVRELEWGIEDRRYIRIHNGRGLGLRYQAASKVYSSGWIVTLGEEVIYNDDEADEDAAKAAAQADYETRILSALEAPAAGDGEPVAWIDFAENDNIRLWTSEKRRADAEMALGRKMTPVYTAPPADAGMREALREAYIAGATAVHSEWVSATENNNGPPRGEPNFYEAASDYAALTAPGATTVPTLVDDPNSASGKRVEYRAPAQLAVNQEFERRAIGPSEPSRSEVTALTDIATERQRQREVEGWTPAHDDTHDRGEMLTAAWCYMQRHADADMWGGNAADEINTLPPPARWPWSREWWKPTNRRRDLVKAGALIVAEIERLDRLDQFEIRRK